MHTTAAPVTELAAAIGFGLFAVLPTTPGGEGVVGRGCGVLLLGTYAAFVRATLAAGGAMK